MSLQYIADRAGNPTAVIIPIDDWNGIRNKYPEVEAIEGDLPTWQKELLDARLKKINEDPDCLRPINELLDELDKDAE